MIDTILSDAWICGGYGCSGMRELYYKPVVHVDDDTDASVSVRNL